MNFQVKSKLSQDKICYSYVTAKWTSRNKFLIQFPCLEAKLSELSLYILKEIINKKDIHVKKQSLFHLAPI